MSDKSKNRKSLSETDITTKRGIGRRALLLGAFGGAGVMAATAASAVSDTGIPPETAPVCCLGHSPNG